MYLQRLILTNFKNYELQKVEFSPQVNCIVGKNGMGKTNLLDAVYYLCMCKSNFGMSDMFVKKRETDFFRLEGIFNKDEKPFKTVAKVIPKQRKEFEIGGVAYTRLAEHIGQFPVVIITPYDSELVREGSEIRRKFLDNTLSQMDTDYLKSLIQYNRLLKQRNACLKKFGETKKIDKSLLVTFDEQLVSPAMLIHSKRTAFIEQFKTIFQDFYQVISNNQESVSLMYYAQMNDNTLEQLLMENQEKDIFLQRSTVGPHKDDLKFSIDDLSLKRFASQGQTKSFILALKLAQYEILRKEKKCTPILLLDDIFDKLDNQRVKYLISLIFNKKFGQIFFTDTDENRLKDILADFDIQSKRFIVNFGEITAC